jgi:chemotaxis family two-component system response regulator Rcp1
MLRILLIEDNPGDVLLIQQALQEHHIDHELHLARDGAEGLAYVAEMGKAGRFPCPNVMLLDLNLPKVSGSEVLTEFRRHPECRNTPVVVISSSDAQRDRLRTSELGIASYFKKPSDFDAFMELGALVKNVTGA